ncbi:MAG TPA: multidrug transporter MatE [Candidatus Lachnoclostridium stercorigallinarum]|uniref:Multidrug transporter MatE n=1 Tax=Candidatus Lachnoclostridium stercorigallinarum TaxID=2838634 RepID=A0A9D2GGZ1_9FIRM|nr:multidrug transporter MatE [Candidatus Lachnoclostridium stercorigallinarum]
MSQYRIFAQYVIPSVLAFALSGIYAIVDGFFVGQSMGDAGLSAINIAFPVVSLMQSLGTGIGMGGAVLWTVRKGTGDEEAAGKYVRATLIMLILATAAATLGLLPFTERIMRLFGAEGEVLELGKEYLDIIVLGAGFQILATGIVPLIRNNGSSFFALVVMVSGFLTNILLDYLFVWVFGLGTSGAAAATILGQMVTTVEAVIYLFYRRLPVFGTAAGFWKMAGNIGKIGIAPFGLTLSPMISLMLINRFSMSYGGEAAVACYACIAYALTIVQVLIQGVGDGSQPLMSRYFGEGKPAQIREIRRMAYVTAAVLAVVSCGVLFLTRSRLGNLFGASDSTRILVAQVMPVFLFGLIFYAFSRITTSGFYATEKNLYSYFCVYAEPALLFGLLFVLPLFLGQSGVWWSVVMSQILTSALALGLKILEDRRE